MTVYNLDQSPFLQSLIADLIREGCSAAIGHVTEPYLDACGQPQYLFPRYVSGYPWAESAYMSMAWGAWREVAVGDPVLAAYATPPVVKLTAPRTLVPGRSYAISAAVTPVRAPGIQRVEFWLSDGKQIDALLGAVTKAPYRLRFDPAALPAPYRRALPPGRYTLEAVAYEDTNPREVGRASAPVVIRRGH